MGALWCTVFSTCTWKLIVYSLLVLSEHKTQSNNILRQHTTSLREHTTIPLGTHNTPQATHEMDPTLPAAEFLRILLPGQVEVQSDGSVQSNSCVVVHDHSGGPWTDMSLSLGKILLLEGDVPPANKSPHGQARWKEGEREGN